MSDEEKICMFCGHRIGNYDFDSVYQAVLDAVRDGYNAFYSGSMGGFDRICESAVIKARESGLPVRLISVRPYHESVHADQSSRVVDGMLYDEIIIPELKSSSDMTGGRKRFAAKRAIVERNRWMVTRSERVIAFVYDGRKGGAADTLAFARRQSRQIINLAERAAKSESGG